VLNEEQVTTLAKRVISMTSADIVQVYVTHTAQVVTRIADGKVLSSNDGDQLMIQVWGQFGARPGVNIVTNQYDDTALLAAVQRCEALARTNMGAEEEARPQMRQVQDTFDPVALWHESTIKAMTAARETAIPELISAVTREQLRAAGFVGFMARVQAVLTKEGAHAYYEETDSEVTMTARAPDGTSSGWGGQAARDWSTLRYADVAAHAIEMAKRGIKPVALEPGRRTAILGPAAVVQILRFLAGEFDGVATHRGWTAFSRQPRGTKIGQRVFDPRINMQSDPADPEGGYAPYFANGYATRAMSWVENGVLKKLAFGPDAAMEHGVAYAVNPYSLRVSGGSTSIEQMIAQCDEGIYVNRVSDVELIDLLSGLMTGVTRDGCFLIKHGKLERPVKNFRFLDSPFFFLNRLQALGPTARAAFGYTPESPRGEAGAPTAWPRWPMIVPPMMVRDFNFSALADAV